MERRERRRVGVFLLLAVAGALSACANDPRRGGVGDDRPFGRRFVHLYEMITGIDDAVAADWEIRTKNLHRAMVGIGEGRDRELRRTVAHPLPDVVGDARDHWPKLTRSVTDISRRIAVDVNTSGPRFWYDLKLLE